MIKRILSLALAIAVLLCLTAAALAAAPKAKRAQYEGDGVVEVDFRKKVTYKNAKVVVKDAAGKQLAAALFDLDGDDVSFRVEGLELGGTYRYTLTGVRQGKRGSYGAVRGSFKVPARPAVRKVEYEADDRELEITFNARVAFTDATVTVTDAAGKAVAATIIRQEANGLEARVPKLKVGKKYTLTVTGVAFPGEAPVTVTRTFTARNR